MLIEICSLLTIAVAGAVPDGATVRTGQVRFEPAESEHRLAPQFRLQEHTFAFRETPQESSATRIRISEVTFPSPLVTPHVNNNTVHCEYFCPLPEAGAPAAKASRRGGAAHPGWRFRPLAHVLPHAGP